MALILSAWTVKIPYTMQKKLPLLAAALCLAVLTAACGKVVPETAVQQESKSFDLEAVVSVVSTADMAVLSKDPTYFPTQNVLLTSDKTLYVQIEGITKDGKREELSWGKAQLALDTTPVPPTANKTRPAWVSTAYTKDGIKLTASDATWALLTFDSAQYQWKLEAKKIKRGYPAYVVRLFTGPDKYLFKVIEERSVSGNARVSLGAISSYDTFLSLLSLQQLQDGLVPDLKTMTLQSTLLNQDVFKVVQYRFPENKTRPFDPVKPVFYFESTTEKEWVRLASLTKSDSDSALTLLTMSPFSDLSAPAKALLKKQILLF
ncbi:MAG: hypothetical protein AB7F28_02275 [Candidatus Margulisiibacteriota bacterium]